MPMPTYPTSEATFAAALNSDPYDAESNPEGLGAGGHRQNFPEGMDAIVALANFVKLAGDYLDALADQVETDAASAAAGSGTEATVANIRAGLTAMYLSIRNVYSANAPVALTDAASIAWNMGSGINFDVTITASGRALANPSAKVIGKSGLLTVIQGTGGSKTITTWGSDYLWMGDQPTWPTVAGALTLIAYFVRPDGKVLLNWGGNSA
ncbi:MAG: hypothetical protein BGO05_27670 [Rhizobiales bacterium 63-7]|nr:hypothetical protein [Hyphomicrobiales bacterium]OJU66992.1 MAG: hypothetical protein BGO05_27670 [Rhizobiales bacterium 63-7]